MLPIIVSPSALEAYLYAHIPMTKAIQLSVIDIQPEFLMVSAPLAPNINHQDTVFGGSASAVAILAAWAFVHTRLTSQNISNKLVIQRNIMNYELPITSTFTAKAYVTDETKWQTFIQMLLKRGRGRIKVMCILECSTQIVGRFEGEFVAFSQ